MVGGSGRKVGVGFNAYRVVRKRADWRARYALARSMAQIPKPSRRILQWGRWPMAASAVEIMRLMRQI